LVEAADAEKRQREVGFFTTVIVVTIVVSTTTHRDY